MTERNEMTLKQGEELEAGGAIVSIDLSYKDKQLQRVEIVTEDGAFAVTLGGYGALALVVPAVYTKYRVSGVKDGVSVDELFETEYEASSRMTKLDGNGWAGFLTVEPTEVRG